MRDQKERIYRMERRLKNEFRHALGPLKIFSYNRTR